MSERAWWYLLGVVTPFAVSGVALLALVAHHEHVRRRRHRARQARTIADIIRETRGAI